MKEYIIITINSTKAANRSMRMRGADWKGTYDGQNKTAKLNERKTDLQRKLYDN